MVLPVLGAVVVVEEEDMVLEMEAAVAEAEAEVEVGEEGLGYVYYQWMINNQYHPISLYLLIFIKQRGMPGSQKPALLDLPPSK